MKQQGKSRHVFILKRNKKHAVRYVVENDEKYHAVYDENMQINFNLKWSLGWVDIMNVEHYKLMKSYQKVNHIPGIEQLSRKKFLAKNLKHLQLEYPLAYNFFPKTFILPADTIKCKQYFQSKSLKSKDQQQQVVDSSSSTYEDGLYIVKPDNLAEGNGIYLINDYNEIKPDENVVVQSYLRPYLINNKKFDLRIYVLITGTSPLSIYIYKDGLARFCSEQYTMNNKDLLYAHLTNYTINKTNTTTTTDDNQQQPQPQEKETIKWSLVELFNYLEEENGINIINLKKKINDIIIKSL